MHTRRAVRPMIVAAVLLPILAGGCATDEELGTNPGDTTPPTVASTTPADAAIGAAVDVAITAVFTEETEPATVSPTTFTLETSGQPVAGQVSASGATATFTPAAALQNDTVYTATLTTGITDLAGNPLTEAFTWDFTTAAAADETAPIVQSTSPFTAAIDVPLDGAISATLSEPVDPSTVGVSTFRVSNATGDLAGQISVDGAVVSFQPLSPLDGRTTYTATLTTGITDLAGNPLATDFSWSFQTELELGDELVRVRISQMDGQEPGSISSSSHPELFQLDPRIQRVVLEFFNEQAANLVKNDTTPGTWRVPLTPSLTPPDSVQGFIILQITPVSGVQLDYGSIEFTSSALFASNPSGLRLVLAGPGHAGNPIDGEPFATILTDQERNFLLGLDVLPYGFGAQFRWTASNDGGAFGGGSVGFSTSDVVVRAQAE